MDDADGNAGDDLDDAAGNAIDDWDAVAGGKATLDGNAFDDWDAVAGGKATIDFEDVAALDVLGSDVLEDVPVAAATAVATTPDEEEAEGGLSDDSWAVRLDVTCPSWPIPN